MQRRWLLVPLLFSVCLAAAAETRVLLIGIGRYELANADLPGIGKDLERMRELFVRIGVPLANIESLSDDAATYEAILAAIERHLVAGTEIGDRAYLYFSGHGSQVPDIDGDEADGLDEVLLAYDSTKRYSRGQMRLGRVLIDDSLDALLAKIPASETIFIVDACHSGTVTRNLNPQVGGQGMGFRAKAYAYSYTRASETIAGLRPRSTSSNLRYVAISAAGDDELAIASEDGSVFTAALHEAVLEAVEARRPITGAALVRVLGERIAERVPANRRFTPRLTGDVTRASDARWFHSVDDSPGSSEAGRF